MIPKSTYTFLEQLSENNTKAWFDINRKRYEEARDNFKSFMQDLAVEIAGIDDDIARNPEEALHIFRINRDLRFSKDKTPYKTNLGGHITMDGQRYDTAGYYLHIEPGNTFIAAGMHAPGSKTLKLIRTHISEHHPQFSKLLDNSAIQKHWGDIERDSMLTRVPRGFEKDDPAAELLKLKNFILVKQVRDEKASKSNFLEFLTKQFKAASPLVTYLNAIVS